MALERNINGLVKKQKTPITSPEYGLYVRSYHPRNAYGADIDMVNGTFDHITTIIETKTNNEVLSEYQQNMLTDLSNRSNIPAFLVRYDSAMSPAMRALLLKFNREFDALIEIEGGIAPIDAFVVTPIGESAKAYISGPTKMNGEEYLAHLTTVKNVEERKRIARK